MVYFYPPEAPTQAIFPTLSAQELINHDCTLAMVRAQTPAPSKEEGQVLEQRLQHRFAEKYGNSIAVKETLYREFADAAHWKAGSLEIISVYDPRHAADIPDDISADAVFFSARLPVVHEIEQNACCRFKEFRFRSIENAQFHRALGIAEVEAALTERVAKLFEALFRDTASLRK
jgi:hypothetical protein